VTNVTNVTGVFFEYRTRNSERWFGFDWPALMASRAQPPENVTSVTGVTSVTSPVRGDTYIARGVSLPADASASGRSLRGQAGLSAPLRVPPRPGLANSDFRTWWARRTWQAWRA